MNLIIDYLICRCHSWTGKCICKDGWDGATCSRPCPFYTYGKGCRNVCTCYNNAQCLPINGICVCAPGKSQTVLDFFKKIVIQ